MSEPKPPSAKSEQLSKQLKESLAARRPKTWKIVLAALVIATLLLLLFAWWMYPRPRPSPLQIVALDAIVTPDEAIKVQAQLIDPGEEKKRSTLGGFTVNFLEPQLPGQKIDVEPRTSKSDANGRAVVDWPTPKTPVGEFFVRSFDEEGKPGASDSGRIFVAAAKTPILLVDADEPLDDKAAETLSKGTQEGWRVVYLLFAAADANDFRKARGGLLKQMKLPPGPAFGPLHADAVKSIRGRFTGTMLAVVKSSDAAQTAKDAGINTILIGDAPAPAAVLRVASWADVVLKME